MSQNNLTKANVLNVVIHAIFVPLILFSSVGFLSYVSIVPLLPQTLQNYLAHHSLLENYLNVGSIMVTAFGAYYMMLDYVGFLVAPVLVASSLYIKHLYTVYETASILKVSLGIFVVSWLWQFLGHGVFEKRAPALLDNLVQALVLAPYFIVFEWLFLFGFRKDLKKDMDERAGALIAEFRKTKQM